MQVHDTNYIGLANILSYICSRENRAVFSKISLFIFDKLNIVQKKIGGCSWRDNGAQSIFCLPKTQLIFHQFLTSNPLCYKLSLCEWALGSALCNTQFCSVAKVSVDVVKAAMMQFKCFWMRKMGLFLVP